MGPCAPLEDPKELEKQTELDERRRKVEVDVENVKQLQVGCEFPNGKKQEMPSGTVLDRLGLVSM